MSVEIKTSNLPENIDAKSGQFLHPRLKRRQDQIESTINSKLIGQNEIAVQKGYERDFPTLFPQSVDQGLIVTPYDEFEGMEPAIPDKESVEGWLNTREYNLRLANSPERISAMRQLESHGFTPPKRIEGVIDTILAKKMIPQLSDLGHNRDVFDGHEQGEQAHRSKLLSVGPFSFVGRHARSFVGLGAMPDINGSVLALETAAKMHALAEVPEVGAFSKPEKQAALAKQALDRLSVDDPILEGRSWEDKEYIVDHWRSNIVGVLEVNPEKALNRARQLYNVGVRSFRPYGHSVGRDIIETTRRLREEFGDEIEIFASQITNVETAKECAKSLPDGKRGADAIIIGVGSGGRCTTAEKAQLIPSNAALAWRLRGEIDIPVIGEGGAVDEVVISILVGMSGVNGSGSVGGGTFEAPGGLFFLTKDGGKTFVKPYGGEASPRTKWLSERTYETGLPYFSEGEQSFKELVPYEESMTQKLLNHWERIILGAVILGIDGGVDTISVMQNLEPSPLLEKSPTTQYLQRTH